MEASYSSGTPSPRQRGCAQGPDAWGPCGSRGERRATLPRVSRPSTQLRLRVVRAGQRGPGLVGDRGGGPSSWPVFRGRGGVESVLGRTLKWLFSASKNLRDSRCVCRAARARSWLVAEQRPEEAPSATRPGHPAGVGGPSAMRPRRLHTGAFRRRSGATGCGWGRRRRPHREVRVSMSHADAPPPASPHPRRSPSWAW